MWSLRDARIRAKLSMILVVPVVAIVALAGFRLVDARTRASDAATAASLASFAADVSSLSHQLHRERMAAAELLAKPGKSDAYNKQAKETDAAVATYTAHRQRLGDVPPVIADRLNRIDQQLSTIDDIRQRVVAQPSASIAEVVLRYGVIVSDLVGYTQDVSQVATDPTIANELRATAAFGKAKAAAEDEQAVAFAALASGRIDERQYTSFVATLTSQQEAFLAFSLSATPAQKQIVDTTITGDAVGLADRMVTQVTRSVGAPSALVSAGDVAQAVGAVIDLMRWAEQWLENELVKDAQAIKTAQDRQSVVEAAVIIVVLTIAVLLALLVARTMARSLARLREGALAVASRDLPEAVARLRDAQDVSQTTPEEIADQVRDPIQLDSRDEIGQVAAAFNVVHREAVRIAAEQAALRTSVSAMFLNLARRSQNLVDRMIGELDQIERGEEDPKRLARLFQLDHLATRMRRNDENLLVLAGADSNPPRREDALLIDIVRAAQSEVELYDRIEFGTVDQDVEVLSHAVNDVVRLLAELFDNATRFSPPTSTVLVDGRRIGDYVVVQIEDRGLGLGVEQMAALNARLAAPPTVDVSAFRMMGLAVVARLASRYGIKVELRPNPDGGTVANVTLPNGILILPRVRGREPVITRPRSPLAVEGAPALPPLPSRPSTPPPAPAYAPPPPAPQSAPPNWPMPASPELVPARAGTLADHSFQTQALNTVAQTSAPPQTRTGDTRATGAAGNWDAPTTTVRTSEAATARQPGQVADDTAELPIFREMEAVWFRSHGRSATGGWAQVNAPAARPAPPAPAPVPVSAPPSAMPVQPAPRPAPVPAPPPIPEQRTPERSADYEETWRTRADEGWRAASAAAQPTTGGTTRSGLPKRVPSAQLVPGGVDSKVTKSRTRRSPEEVRGLLSAYHRGVQRGRSGAEGSPPIAEPPATEETIR
ncbi:MAG TPA: sensor histidine kinase [Micromonosporaceae bacterium]